MKTENDVLRDVVHSFLRMFEVRPDMRALMGPAENKIIEDARRALGAAE